MVDHRSEARNVNSISLCVCVLSHVQLFAAPWIVACQACPWNFPGKNPFLVKFRLNVSSEPSFTVVKAELNSGCPKHPFPKATWDHDISGEGTGKGHGYVPVLASSEITYSNPLQIWLC